MRPLIDAWRSTTSRLILIYGALFVLWSVVLLGAIQWETSRYLTQVIDQLLEQRLHYLAAIEGQTLRNAVAASATPDPRDTMAAGLFDADGRYLAGTIDRFPAGLVADGRARLVPAGILRQGRSISAPARAAAERLPNGERVVLAKDTSTVDGVGAIIRRALLWGLSLTILPGLIGGAWLSRGPARRIRALQDATAPIRDGDLGRRLPVSRRGDELDMLAGIVNTMLDEIERLMGEVKGVCDNIAHDLRTPLTRLRARLYRAQQQLDGQPQATLVEGCLTDIDGLLARFRALLRISELEDRKRSACFAEIDLGQVLRDVHEFYAPLAEDHGQRFELEVPPLPVSVRADPHLLFEAFANLVGNAVKFTPPGGWVGLRVAMEAEGPRVDVLDNGPGVPPGEREAVKRRFYRGDNSRTTAGSGLGLSIVSAIARLHGYALEVGDGAVGARISLYCHPGGGPVQRTMDGPVVEAEGMLAVGSAPARS